MSRTNRPRCTRCGRFTRSHQFCLRPACMVAWLKEKAREDERRAQQSTARTAYKFNHDPWVNDRWMHGPRWPWESKA